MATRPLILPRALLGLAIAGLVACSRGEEESATVARVGDKTITVEEVAGYMQRANYGANVRDVERAVNEMIDAHLVLARARERYTPAPVESLQMEEWRNTLILNQFRDDVIWKDVQVDEAKLQEWYDQNVGEQVTVDHILVRAVQTATPEEKQAAKREADSLLVAIRGGAEFAAASSQNGGRMQPFGRGQMVAAFETAAFTTPVGDLAPVVETQFGYHILRVVERKKPALEDMREEIEDQLARPMQNEVEDRYVTQLMETSRLEFHERNIDSLIGILDAERLPEGGERELVLATFDGGTITLGEIWGLYEVLPPGNRQVINDLDQPGFVQALASMAQQKIMLARATEAKTVLDSVRQGQLDERIDQLLLSAYMRDVSQARLQVDEAEVRRYYDEHMEFSADRPFEEVAAEIQQVLGAQRMEEVSSAEAQRATLAAIADSQESAIDVTRNTDTYEDVLRVLRQNREAEGIPEPGPAHQGGSQPVTGGRPPAGATAPGGATEAPGAP